MQTSRSTPQLALPGQAPTPGPSQAPGLPPRLAQLQAQHEAASAQFAQVQAAKTMLDHVKSELDQLTRLGDMVTPEDVIEGAGKLVAAGAPAGQIAALLSSMPQASGAGLQGWLAQQEQMVAQKEAQLMPAHSVLGHRMALTALGVINGASGGGDTNALGASSAPAGAAQPPIQSGASALNIEQG